MEGKWTKGPWRMDEEAEDVVGCRDILSADYPLASTHGLYDDEEDKANARLIAEAPAMANALQVIHEHVKGPLSWDKSEALRARMMIGELCRSLLARIKGDGT